MFRNTFVGFAFLLAAAVAAAQPRPNLRLGLWRVEVEMSLPGKGPKTDGAVAQEVCLTQANLTQIVMPQDPNCNGRVTKQTEREMEWRMQCSHGPTETFSRAHMEFYGDKFASAILTTAKPYNMEFKTVVRGKFLGSCSADKARQAYGPVQNPPPLKSPRSEPDKPAAPLAPYKP